MFFILSPQSLDYHHNLISELFKPPTPPKKNPMGFLCVPVETVTSLLAKTLNPKNGNGAHTASTPGKMRGSESAGPQSMGLQRFRHN